MLSTDSPKIAVITGGAGGLGFACAQRLANDGVDVALLDLDEDAAQAAAQRLSDDRHLHLGCGAEVTIQRKSNVRWS